MKSWRDTWTAVAIISPGIPFLFMNNRWAKATFIAYTLTAGLFGILMVGEYPPVETRWFWKALPPIVIIHCVIVTGLVMLDLDLAWIHSLPSILFSVLGVIGILEWRLSLRIIKMCRSKLD
jgi:hypothetical protein